MQKSTWVKISIVLAIILIFVLLQLRKPFILENQPCPDCIQKSDCKSYCMKKCLPRMYDQITATGSLNQSIFCDCTCQTTLHVLQG